MLPYQILDFGYIKNGSFIPKIELQTFLLMVILSLIIKLIVNKSQRNIEFIKAAAFLPGPPALPLFQNGFEYLFPGNGGIPRLQLRHTKKYGPMYKIWFGNQLWVCLSDPEDLQVVYRSTKVLGRQTILEPVYLFFGDGISATRSTPRWKTERRIVQSALTKNVMKSSFGDLNVIIRNFISGLQSRANGKEFDIKYLFGDLSLDIHTTIEYGCKLEAEEKKKLDFLDNSEKMQYSVGAQIFFPILTTKLLNFVMYKISLGRIKSLFIGAIEKMLAKRSVCAPKTAIQENKEKLKKFALSFVSTLYQIFQETGQKKLLFDELLTLLNPGVAPTARTLSYAMLMMGIYPDIQEKLYREILSIVGDEEKEIDYDDITRLTYLDQVHKEILRLYMPGTTTFREVNEEVKIRSYNLPVGTGLMINNGAVHMNAKYYPEPYKFNPDHFSPEAVAKRPENTFIPFGGGARRCIGQEYTTTIFKLTMIEFLRNFEIHTSMKQEDIIIAYRLVTILQNGNHIALTKRVNKN